MAVVTVRNLSDETHRALKVLAAEHGRSTEAEIREILDNAARPQSRLKIGSELAAFARRYGAIDFEFSRDPTPTDVATFD
jgi:plasmid stability protein